MLHRDYRGMCYPQLSGFTGGVLFGRIMMSRSRSGPCLLRRKPAGAWPPYGWVGGKKQYSWLATRVEEGRDFSQPSFDGSRESLPPTLILNHSRGGSYAPNACETQKVYAWLRPRYRPYWGLNRSWAFFFW